jgi:type VI secretion system protein ImpJ
MSAHNRVIWSEGLFLQPQHFQQQERYFERYVETRCQPLVAQRGFTELSSAVSSTSLLGLRGVAGVFDGPFRMPGRSCRRD